MSQTWPTDGGCNFRFTIDQLLLIAGGSIVTSRLKQLLTSRGISQVLVNRADAANMARTSRLAGLRSAALNSIPDWQEAR